MHNIEQYDVQEGITQAWHGLTTVRPRITLDDNWLTKWDVERVPLYVNEGGEFVQLPFDMLRSTGENPIKIGSPIGESYAEINNKEFLDLIKESIGGAGHDIISVGSLRNRGRVFVTVKLNQDKPTEVDGREYKDFLTFGNSHDRSCELFVVNSNVCTVCDNTFSCNLATVRTSTSFFDDMEDEEADSSDNVNIRLRHTKHAKTRLPKIAKLIDKALGVRAEFYRTLGELSLLKTNIDEARNLFTGFLASPDAKTISTRTAQRANEMAALFENGKGNRGDNMLDVFQAATDYFTHLSVLGRNENKWRQWESSEFGRGAQQKREFFTLLEKGIKHRGDATQNPITLCENRGRHLIESMTTVVV